LLLGPGVRKSPLTALLIGCAAVLAAIPARAATDAPPEGGPGSSEPVVVPIPAPATAAATTAAPAVPPPQAEDDETPHAHSAPETAATTFNRSPAPVSAEPETSQLALGLVLGVVTVFVAIEAGASSGGNARWWAAGGVLAGGAAATGVVTCALGQTSATRHRGCGASLAGALLGALGVVPGLLLLKYQASRPCTATGPNDDDQCVVNASVDALLDLALAGGGYVLGTAFGARAGWELGAVPRAAAPATNVTLLSLTF
jgi:hypothetical protein